MLYRNRPLCSHSLRKDQESFVVGICLGIIFCEGHSLLERSGNRLSFI